MDLFFDMLFVLALDSVYDKDKRQELIDSLDWPDVADVRRTERETDAAYAAMAALGVELDLSGGIPLGGTPFDQNDGVPPDDAAS